MQTSCNPETPASVARRDGAGAVAEQRREVRARERGARGF